MGSDSKKVTFIDLESPSSRSMDKSPRELAKQLSCSINTVKQRLRDTKIDFCMENDNGYQMYHYECLPILTAYLDVKHWSIDSKQDYVSFLNRLIEKLDTTSGQLFCKQFLYNQSFFQGYLLSSKLDEPITSRLKCIDFLIHNYTIFPTMSSQDLPFETFSETLKNLDNIIFELSTYYNSSDFPEDVPQNTVLQVASSLAKEWCGSLSEKRKSIVKEGKILLGVSLDRTAEDFELRLSAALDKELSEKTLTNDERKRAENIDSFLTQISDRQIFINHIMSESEQRTLENDIESLMEHNLSNYLTAVFEMRPIPDFSIPDDCVLDQMVVEQVRRWYQETLYTVDGLTRSILGLVMWQCVDSAYCLQQSSCLSPPDLSQLNNFLIGTQKQIHSYWQIMGSTSNSLIVKNQPFASVVNTATISRNKFGGVIQHQETKDCLEEICTRGESGRFLDSHLLLAASAVTLEVFWRMDAKAHASYLVHRCVQYQEAFSKAQEIISK